MRFVKITAAGHGHGFEMVAPTERALEALADLASICPTNYVWTATPVDELGLRSQSAVPEETPK